MHKATWGQMWPHVGKIEILEKRLSPTAQNHYANQEDTCRDKVTKVGVIVRYTKKERLGSNLTPGGRLRVNNVHQTRPCTVTDLKLKHTEQDVAFLLLVTTIRHIISIELNLLYEYW